MVFGDGYGRAGRALIHVVLQRRGTAPQYVPPISVVFAGDQDRYVNGLTLFRGDHLAAWGKQFATATRAAAWSLIEILSGYPVSNAPVAAAAIGRSKPQIYQSFAQLETAGGWAPLAAAPGAAAKHFPQSEKGERPDLPPGP